MKVVVAIYSEFASWCIPDGQVERLRRAFPEDVFVRGDSDEETLAVIADAEVAFSSVITPAHLDRARRLRWIHSPSAGVGSMLFPAMIASDVVITNSRGNSAVTIAEHTVAVALALLRDLPFAWRRQMERTWAQDEFNAGASMRTLCGLRVLVVGLGAIGGQVARLMIAFGAEVFGVRRHVHAANPPGIAAVVPPSSLSEELPRADVVVLAAPLTPETRHMINARALRSMKAGSVLINVSRGKLIDEAALVDALEMGSLRGAALDVFEHEPLAADSPLWSRRDVIITPHVSGFHANFWPVAGDLFSENLLRYKAGQPLLNVVDKRAGY